MQLPWPLLRDSDLAAVELERWDLGLGKPELLSASKPLLPTTFPVGFQTLPHQCSPFPPPTHSNSDHANKVAVSSYHSFKIPHEPHLALGGCGKRWLALNLPKITHCLIQSVLGFRRPLRNKCSAFESLFLFSSLRWHLEDGEVEVTSG